MTQLEAMGRLRNLINEATAGFYSNDQLYQMLDSATLQAITIVLAQMRKKRQEGNKYYTSRLLQPLHRTFTATTTAGSAEYAPPELVTTLYIDIDSVYLDADNAGTKYPCVRAEMFEGRKGQATTYYGFESKSPAYYIRGDRIGFFPTPTSSSGSYEVYYWINHTTVASGTSSNQMPLHIEGHEAMLRLALADALIMDDRSQEAEIHRNWATQMITALE